MKIFHSVKLYLKVSNNIPYNIQLLLPYATKEYTFEETNKFSFAFRLTSMTCRTFSSSPGVVSADLFEFSTAVSFWTAPLKSLRRLPKDGSVLPACNVQYACKTVCHQNNSLTFRYFNKHIDH